MITADDFLKWANVLGYVAGGGSGGGVTPIQIQENTFNNGVDSGIADAYVVTLNPSAAFTATNGTAISFSPLNANATTTPTLSVNGSSPLPIVLPNNTDVQAGDINTSSVAVYVVYSNGVWLLMNPLLSFGGATPTQVQQSAFNIGIDSGLADAYNVALSPAVVSLTNGMVIEFLPLNPNATTSPTLAINGGTPYQISLINSTSPVAGDLSNSFNAYLIWNATTEGFILLNPLQSYVIPGDIQYSQYLVGYDTGIADAYAINLSPAISSYYLGNIFIFLPANTNLTTTPTLAVNGLSPLTITRSSGPLLAGDLSTSEVAICVYNSGQSNIILLNPSAQSGIEPIDIQQNTFCSGTDSGVADAYVVTLSPSALISPANGSMVAFNPLYNNSTTTPTISVNGTAAFTIVLPTGSPVQAGDISTANLCYVVFDEANSYYYLLTPAISYGASVTPEQVQNAAFNYGSDTGSTDTYQVTLSPAVTSYTDGLIVTFFPNSNNTSTAPTLSVNGLAALPIQLPQGTVIPGDLGNLNGYSWAAICLYNGSLNGFSGGWVLLNPLVSTATSTQIQQSSFNTGHDTGTADAYIVALSPVVNSYTNGLEVIFTPAHANLTTTPTLDAGAGAKTIQKSSGPVLAGSLSTSMIAVCYYSQAANAFILTTPAL